MIKAVLLTIILGLTSCSLSVQRRGPASELDCFETISNMISKKNSFTWVRKQVQSLKWQSRRAQLSMLTWFAQNIWESPQLAQGMAELMTELKLTKAEFEKLLPDLSKSKRFHFDYRFPKVVLIDNESAQFFKKEISVDQIAELFKLDDEFLEVYRNNSQESLLTAGEWNELLAQFKKLDESERDSVVLGRLIPYFSTLAPKERVLAVREGASFLKGDSSNPRVVTFYKKMKKFEGYQKKLEIKFQGLSESEKQINVMKALKTYENLSLSCRSKGQTFAKRQAAKNGTKFFMGVGLVSTSGSYFYNNWDKEKDSKWYGNLGYDIVTASIFNFAFAKILGNNQSGFATTSVKSYATFAGLDFLSAQAYSELFGVSKDDAVERLNEIVAQPEAREKLEQLFNELESEDLDGDVQKVITDLSQLNEVSSLEEMLASEETREKLIEAISLDMYYKDSGDWIRTGDKGTDRYLFHRAYDSIGTPKGIAVGMVIFNILCRDATNPKKALAKALSIYIADKIASDFIYYKLRRKAINL